MIMQKKSKNKKITELPFIKGQYIKKANDAVFNVGWNGVHKFLPAVQISSAWNAGDYWFVNGRYRLDLKNIEIIFEEEAKRLNEFFLDLKLDEPISQSVDETCF